jgi:hypothetical protein
MAHIGKEARFRAARLLGGVAGDFEALHQIGQLRFALFDRRDVGPGGDGPTLLRAVLANPQPSAVGQFLLLRCRRIAMKRQPTFEPCLAIADGGIVVVAIETERPEN